MQHWARSLAISLFGLMAACDTVAQVQEDAAGGSPDILVLGDSQLSFGAGEAFVDLFAAMQLKNPK